MLTTLMSRRTFGAGVATAAAASLVGCSGGEEQDSNPGGSRPDRVRVLTGAGPSSWESYLDLAIREGWFAEANIEVEVLPGEGTNRNLEQLTGGQVEFAALDVSAAMMAYAAGSGGFRLTAVLHNNLLACVAAPASSGIRQLRDLEGRSVAVLAGGTNTVLLPALGRLAGFDPDKVEQVPLFPPFPPYLASGEVDASLEFLPNQPLVEATVGEPVEIIPYAEWIPELYGSATGVTTELAEQNPDLVRRFNEVSMRALQHSVDHPDQAAEAFVAANQEQNLDLTVAGLELLAPYVRAEPGFALGQFNPDRLVQTSSLLEELGAISTFVEPDEIVSLDLYRRSDEDQ